jgi:hypothetical protein
MSGKLYSILEEVSDIKNPKAVEYSSKQKRKGFKEKHMKELQT